MRNTTQLNEKNNSLPYSLLTKKVQNRFDMCIIREFTEMNHINLIKNSGDMLKFPW